MPANYSNTTLTILIILVLGIMIFLIVYFSNKKSSNRSEKFAPFDSQKTFNPSNLNQTDIACNLPIPQKRYMYLPVPPARNSSYDVRNPPYFMPPADKSRIGIFQHTDIFGNYANERICPNYKQMEDKLTM